MNSLWGGSQRKPIGSLALFQVHRATRYSFVSDMLTQSNKGPDFEMGGNRSHGKHGSSEGLSEEDASLSHIYLLIYLFILIYVTRISA